MGWMVSFTPRPRLTPGERTPCIHWTGGWVGPRAGLAAKARGKFILPLPGIEPQSPRRPVRGQTLYWLSYPGSNLCIFTTAITYHQTYFHLFAYTLSSVTPPNRKRLLLSSGWVVNIIIISGSTVLARTGESLHTTRNYFDNSCCFLDIRHCITI
jgi:hypothetical protein